MLLGKTLPAKTLASDTITKSSWLESENINDQYASQLRAGYHVCGISCLLFCVSCCTKNKSIACGWRHVFSRSANDYCSYYFCDVSLGHHNQYAHTRNSASYRAFSRIRLQGYRGSSCSEVSIHNVEIETSL